MTTTPNIIEPFFPTWQLISSAKELNEYGIIFDDLDFNNYNYIICHGGEVISIKCLFYDYLFDKKPYADVM